MDYQSTLDYLFTQLPMYQRIGAAAYKTDLSNTLALCEVLNHPEKEFKSIHIAGTNGKGSTAHMLSAVLQAEGYKVGLYTSPHLKDFRERIKINGQMIAEERVIQFVEQHQEQFEALNLSFFEWTVGLAFRYFADECVDIAVIETGLGGRLDSTNVVTPEITIITSIGFDHEQFLGNTLEKIAGEKAGIIKPSVPVIIGERQPAIEHVFIAQAKRQASPITFASDGVLRYETDLQGAYQKVNLLTAQEAIDQLRNLGWELEEHNVRYGLMHVTELTGLLGRWQKLGENPCIICDTGHNVSGLTYVLDQLKSYDYQQLHVVFGVVDDKKLERVLQMMPKTANYYFCQANIQRALDASLLRDEAAKNGLDGVVYESVNAALEAAKQKAGKDDLIFVGGSTFVVAEVV